MYNIGDVVKVIDWEEMEFLATEIWHCEKHNEKIIVCAFDYSIINSNEGKDICGQEGIITNIIKKDNINCYKIKFFEDNFKKYNNNIFDRYLLICYNS